MIDPSQLCTLHKRTMYVMHDPDRTPRYVLRLTNTDQEIGEAMTLDGIIRIADAYQEVRNA